MILWPLALGLRPWRLRRQGRQGRKENQSPQTEVKVKAKRINTPPFASKDAHDETLWTAQPTERAMDYLLSLMRADTGDVADVDVDLSALDLDTQEGKDALAAAVKAALAELDD